MRRIRSWRAAHAAVILFGCLTATAAAQGTSGSAVEAEVATAPVTLDGAVLFRVRGVSSYPADARAAAISRRIADAAADPSIGVDSLRTVALENAVRIDAGGQPLMAVVDADAALEQLSRAELATAHLINLKEAIAEYRQARTPAARWRSGGRTLIATVLFAAAIAFLFWVWRWIEALMERRVQSRIYELGVQSSEVARAEQIRAALRSLLFGVRVVALGACALAYVGYVLAQWPATRGLSRGTLGLALDPLRALGGAFVATIPQLAFLAVLFVVIRVVLRVLHMLFDAVGRGTVTLGNFDAEWAQPTYKILRLLIVAFGLVVAYPYIPGSNSEAFKGVSLFIGVVFSLGSSSAISNIIAGYMMTYRRAFRVGDLVKIGDAMGLVMEVRLQVTHLRNYRNEEIVIPNSQILGAEVVNYSSLAKTQPLMASIEVGIGYGTSWQEVERILLDAAARTPGIAEDPKPRVLVRKLGDFAVTYELTAPCAEPRTLIQTSTALNKHVLDVFNEHGVQIMVPAYEADPPEPKIAPATAPYSSVKPAPSPRETVAAGNRTI